MRIEMRRGVWMYPGRPVAELVAAVETADQCGLDEVWIADEGVAREPIVALAAAARTTTRIRLAVGITSPLLRHPGAIASSIATLDELSAGRAVLGLGVGGHESLGPFGLIADRPVAQLRDAIEMARAVLEGRAVPGYQPPRHASPARPVPIWVGARGPQLVRLAGRLADGLFVSGADPAELPRLVDELSVGAIARTDGRRCDMAIYRSASNGLDVPDVAGWDDIGALLAGDVASLAPASIGINLVDLAPWSSVDEPAPTLVERAAAILLDVPV